jgi:hypothetical protein
MSSIGLKLAQFTAVMAVFGGLLSVPAGYWGGGNGQIALLAAWLLSVVPGWLTLSAGWFVRSPQQGVLLALGATVVRLLFVAFGTLVILQQGAFPELQFAVWVVSCYLGALGVETGLVLRGAPPVDGSSAAMALSLLVNPGGR